MTCRQIALAALLSSALALPAAAQDTVDVGKLPVDLAANSATTSAGHRSAKNGTV